MEEVILGIFIGMIIGLVTGAFIMDYHWIKAGEGKDYVERGKYFYQVKRYDK